MNKLLFIVLSMVGLNLSQTAQAQSYDQCYSGMYGHYYYLQVENRNCNDYLIYSNLQQCHMEAAFYAHFDAHNACLYY